MKKNPRFSNEQQILDKIDDYRKRAVEALNEADKLEADAKAVFKMEDGQEKWEKIENAKFWLAEAHRLRRRADRFSENRVRDLSQRLAVIRTELLSNVGFTDISIPRYDRR